MSKFHPISRYDNNLCLKPNITIWLISLLLLRTHATLILSNMKNLTGLIDLVYPDRPAMSLGALDSIRGLFITLHPRLF